MANPVIDAIASHRAAWQAFQDAPYGPDGSDEEKEARWAECAEQDTIDELLRTTPTSASDVAALKAHLDWYVVEEVQRREITPEMFVLHAAIELARADGTALANRVKEWFTVPGGEIDTPENLEQTGLEVDAELLRHALEISP